MSDPRDTSPRAGVVAEVWVFPVKSMSGASLGSSMLASGGLAGDRAWAVVDEAGGAVTAAQEPRLRQVGTRVDADGAPALDVPGAAAGLAPGAAEGALSQWLGRPLRLTHRDGPGFVDVAPVHVVSRASMADAAHAEACDACDVTAPRANLVLDLEPAGASERDWLGATVSVGDAVLRMISHPDHCLGAYAEVVREGRVSVGDPVVVSAPAEVTT